MLAAEVLGQLRIQRGLENVLRELAEQAARPRQAHTLLPRLREQTLCDFPLNDDPPGHGINHLLVNNNNGRVSHDHFLPDQARPLTHHYSDSPFPGVGVCVECVDPKLSVSCYCLSLATVSFSTPPQVAP